MTLAIVTLTAVRNGDQITLIDRQGNKVADVSSDQLIGIHQPEEEHERYVSVNLLHEDSDWGRFARRCVRKDWEKQPDKWQMKASALASSFHDRHRPRVNWRAKPKERISWEKSAKRMHGCHRKRVCLATNPVSKWTAWADSVRTNCRKRFAGKIVQE